MLTKSDYRLYFAKCKKYIKFNSFLKDLNINQSAFSKFMKDDVFDYELSLSKLDLLYCAIVDFIESIKIA
mgnify:CR=1 FL=1|jgi:hypothetical protein